ncbi:hypothetical protein BUALT_Bualt08G0077700 [Buddleja alternifolia]|uniref:Uncharacterized protein n=1 Tax=Buddleja alternifolia TaxID=168488 RepID=A0AAV6X608_9LAMI|nr:hypothetical protein BUALT_Bualt08G0077700 [Buddleja alternifolia]
MSGFFSLGSSNSKDQDQDRDRDQEHDDHNHHTDTNNSLFLFKNEEIYNKGFELWQQYYQLHQQRQIQDHVDFSVGPSTKRNNHNDIVVGSSFNIGDDSPSYRSGFSMSMRQSSSRSGNEGINCQDCGNQAKKDCVHLRCRTCCKSRGFQCQTHVKSTWVPASKRRERQQQLAALQQDQVRENPKRMRENTGGGGGGGGGSALVCTTTTSRLPASTSGFELGHFPAEVNSEAVFRCVRVSAVDDAEEHLAYQTAVNIGGHVFKGILYDQGPHQSRYGPGECSGSQQQPLDLIAAAAASAATTSNQNMAMIDPSSIYPAPLNAFMAGTQFFPPPRH